MPISTTSRKAGPYPGNGVARDFSFSFKIFSPDELQVSATNAQGVAQILVFNVDYTVNLNPDQDADAGGVVTLSKPLAAGLRLVILSDIEALQPIDLTNQGGFYPDTVNEGFDRTTALIQQIGERIGRTVTVPPSYEGTNLNLPEPQPGQLLAWSDSGLSNLDPSGLVTVVAYGNAVVDKFDGDGTTTMFSLSSSPGNERNMRVSVAGVVQTPGEDFFWGGGQVLGFFTPPPAGTRIVVQFQQALPESADAAPDLRQLIMWLPENLRASVIAGTNTADLAPYLNTAFAVSGARYDAGGYTYLIGSRLRLATGVKLLGYGAFKATATFSDAAIGDGLHMLVRPANGAALGKDIVFDGSEVSSLDVYGCRNTGPLSDFTCYATFKNLSFIGIDISSNLRLWANSDIEIGSRVENVGWRGINVEQVTRLRLNAPSVYLSGFDAFMLSYCKDIDAHGFHADKSTPPFHIYDGPGSYGGAEEGFLFGHFGCQDGRFSNFYLNDNRNAGSDGWGIGEDGSLGHDESKNLVVSNGIIEHAGLFGFDCTGNMVVRGLIVKSSSRQGIMVGLDLGGTIRNVDVEASVFDAGVGDAGCGGIMFLSPGAAPRTVNTASGSPVVEITGGSGFHVVPGQKVSGAGIPAGTTVVSVEWPNATLSANATATATGVSAVFRGVTRFENIRANIKVDGAPYGIILESGTDGHASYSNVEVTGDLSQNIATGKFVHVVNGSFPAGVRVTPDVSSMYGKDEIGLSTMADYRGVVRMQEGETRLSNNVAIAVPIFFGPGSWIAGPGVLTFRDVEAPRQHIFKGANPAADSSWLHTRQIMPEWWGAAANDAVECGALLNNMATSMAARSEYVVSVAEGGVYRIETPVSFGRGCFLKFEGETRRGIFKVYASAMAGADAITCTGDAFRAQGLQIELDGGRFYPGKLLVLNGAQSIVENINLPASRCGVELKGGNSRVRDAVIYGEPTENGFTGINVLAGEAVVDNVTAVQSHSTFNGSAVRVAGTADASALGAVRISGVTGIGAGGEAVLLYAQTGDYLFNVSLRDINARDGGDGVTVRSIGGQIFFVDIDKVFVGPGRATAVGVRINGSSALSGVGIGSVMMRAGAHCVYIEAGASLQQLSFNGPLIGATAKFGAADALPNFAISGREKLGLAGGESVSANVDRTLSLLTSVEHLVLTGALTANRTVTLPTAVPMGRENASFTITNKATGAFSIAVGSLATFTGPGWITVKYIGSAWVVTAFGGSVTVA